MSIDVKVYLVSGQGSTFYNIYECVKHADEIRWLDKGGDIPDSLAQRGFEQAFAEGDAATIEEYIEDIKTFARCDNDRVLHATAPYEAMSMKEVMALCKQHDFNVIDEWEGYIY